MYIEVKPLLTCVQFAPLFVDKNTPADGSPAKMFEPDTVNPNILLFTNPAKFQLVPLFVDL